MSWLTAIWSMIAAACLTLAGIYLPVWIRDRTAWPSFFFSVMAVATAVFAFCELALLRAPTPQAYASRGSEERIPLDRTRHPDYMCMDSMIPRKRVADILTAIGKWSARTACASTSSMRATAISIR